MRSRRLLRPAMAVVVLAASQVGHLLTSELRQGPRALAPASTGVHAYVPALSTLAAGAAGAALLAALLAVGAARAVRPGRRTAVARAARPDLLDLTAALFAAQLATYLVQETLEAVMGGARLPSAGDLVLWGCLGQLPTAAVAAAVLRWLTGSVEAAVAELAEAAALAPRPALVAARPRTPTRPVRRCRRPTLAVSQRGPPLLLRPV